VGTDTAYDVAGTLQCSSSYITINGTTGGDWGMIAPGDTVEGTPWSITAAASTPVGTVADFGLSITASGGYNTQLDFSLVIGMLGVDYVTHDCGNVKFTVTRYGALGYMASSGTVGEGFCYPISSSSQLYYGGFAAGNSASYVVDRYYESGSADDTDWETTASPDGMVRMYEPGPNNFDEYTTARYDDAGHPTPQDLVCDQYTWAWDDATANDFVIMKFVLINEGSSTLSDLYGAVFMDWDIGSSSSNYGSSEAARNLTWMYATTPYVGVATLDPPRDSTTSNANLALIDHATYVYPYGGLPDNIQIQFMDGTIQNASSNRPYDWSTCNSAGPFTLDPGAARVVAFAVIGGDNLSDLQANADTAYNRYWDWLGIEEVPASAQITGIRLYPVISRGRPYKIAYSFVQETPVQVKVYDALGRLVVHQDYGRLNGSGEFTFDLKSLAQGVYFVKIISDDHTSTRKVIWLK